MKNEMKVILCLMGLLLSLELGARIFETKLSKDVEHLRELPAQAKTLKEAPSNAFKVLILGNSLARCGINLEVLQKGLEEKYHKPIVIAKMHPDASRIEAWAYGYRRYFEDTGSNADLILTTTGSLHLSDNLQNITGMGAFYVSNTDFWGFCRDRLSGVEDISRFCGARASTLWAHRDRVEPLFFYKAVPSYAETAQEINRSISVEQQRRAARQPKVTCEVFQEFAKKLKSTNTQFVIASVPMPESYVMPEEILKAIRSSGASLIDLGTTLKFPKERFPDGYHLDAEGAVMFTREVLARWPATKTD